MRGHQTLCEADPSLWTIQADFINAFNLVDREAVLGKVCDNFPEILAWVTTCYGQHSHLLFGSYSISSQCGVHQGDPLATLLFSLVLQQLVILIKERRRRGCSPPLGAPLGSEAFVPSKVKAKVEKVPFSWLGLTAG